MSIFLSHPTGNANVRQALRAFDEAGLLGGFFTTVAAFSGNFWDRLSQLNLGAEFRRRAFDDRLREKTVQMPGRELARLLATRIGFDSLVAHQTGFFCIDNIYRNLDRRVASTISKKHPPTIRASYCYEDGASESFGIAKQRGVKCIYDLPIGFWRTARRIQSEEASLLPEWAGTMPALVDSDAKIARKDAELQLADAIIVASSFTAATLEDAPFPVPSPIVIPYGCPETYRPTGGLSSTAIHQAESETARRRNDERGGFFSGPRHQRSIDSLLRVLFVGGLSQRKGLSYLFDSLKSFEKAMELTVIGRKPATPCRPLDAALAKCRYIQSLPHEKILNEMALHDVLVFPSLFEGFGLVITEALSQGIPVITTPHTCGPDIIDDGVDGFIVPIRDSQAIAEKLELLHRDRERLAAMKQAALEKAAKTTWERYRRDLVKAVRAVLD